MPCEGEIVDESIDDEAVEAQRPNVFDVGRGPANFEIEHHVASGHAQHRTWCDACMRARGIAGKTRKTGAWSRGRGSAGGDMKLDGTEDDDDDDDDDEMTQIKMHILVAKDAKTGTYEATCRREGVNTPRRRWCPCFFDMVIAERYCKVMESHRSWLSTLRRRWRPLLLS